METLTIQNIRCFTNPKPVLLAPLTLLVGENSTGKSTFLALMRLAWDIAYSHRDIDFNEEPFLLGAWDQIANYRGGRAGRATSFGIGLERPFRPRKGALHPVDLPADARVSFSATFRKSGSHPVIAEQSLQSGPYTFRVVWPEKDEHPAFDVRIGEKRIATKPIDYPFGVGLRPAFLMDWFYMSAMRRDSSVLTNAQRLDLEAILMQTQFGPPRPIASAPVRTKPLRTYNPVRDIPMPEGEHVPMVLAKMFFEDKEKWQDLKGSLERFGRASNLFSSVEIKPLGKHESDPFQIRVRIDGPSTNLIDVGYGVSQVLPLLVDSILAREDQLYLLQQPEVHLHPKGQAELGTFLAQIIRRRKTRFIVETHSDYLIDRVRMDVRDAKGLKPSDVAILFFERNRGEVDIHQLSLDQMGNFAKVPPGYRQFFLAEERRLLGA
jgi:AAA ATPase domain